MNELRSAAVGIALAVSLASAPAWAQDTDAPVPAPAAYAAPTSLPSAPVQRADPGDGAWDTKYGMIFSIENIFQNNSDAVIGDFGGGVGLQLNLSPQSAIRFSVNLSRETHPAYATETTSLVTGTKYETFVAPSDFTSRYDVDVGALYVMRLSPSSIAPYLGVGGGIGYLQEALKYEDDTDPTFVTEVDNLKRTTSLNAAGVLGVDWRLHRAVSIFAEYGLGVALVSLNSDDRESRTTSKLDGSVVSGTKREGSSTEYLEFGTGLGQGGRIGLVAFF